MDQRKSIPSMFHRRLLLLAVVFALLLTLLGTQMLRLSVVEGAERRALAESRLDRRDYLPTFRGEIVDRHGRVLALDRAADDLALVYEVITGTWVRTQAREEAKEAVGKARWNSLGPEAKERLSAGRMLAYRQRVEALYDAICQIGNISREDLQARIDLIKADVQSSAAATWERQRLAAIEEYGISEDEFRPDPIAAQTESHVVLQRLPPEQTFDFRRLAQDFPGMLEVKASRRREYPWLTANVPLSRASLPREIRKNDTQVITVVGVADHVLGSVRDQVWASDMARRPFENPTTGEVDLRGYRREDSVGARGIEAVFEDVLRGRRGEVRQRLDSGERARVDPVPGGNVRLTLDIALQARIQAILSHEYGLTVVHEWQHNTLPLGTPLNAAAVVIEVETGEILAMVSMPSMAMGAAMDDAARMANQPFVNRASEAIYPPGSIIKPLVLAAAVTEGVHNLDNDVDCKGFYFESMQHAARCWIYREKYGMHVHGRLKAAEALARSCNIFFYTLGDGLGVNRLRDWLASFGLGQLLDIGLTARGADGSVIWTCESKGQLPSDELIRQWREKGETKFNETIMGIGQGPMTWTPLQAANAYATLAREGIIRDATIVVDDPRGTRPSRHADLHLNPQLVQTAIEGLRQSVEEQFGTGHHITRDADGSSEPILNAHGVTVWAKTGTAEAPPLRTQDTNGDGKIDGKDTGGIEDLDHSWFVGLVGPKNGKPMFAIAVLVEYGGSGGRTAGPIANQIIRGLQSEGYLPGDANAPPLGDAPIVKSEPEDDGGDD